MPQQYLPVAKSQLNLLYSKGLFAIDSNRSTIAIALSSGGFRATLFHLGVIRYLRSTGRLKDVRHIASVSGGSILAGHLAANWQLYTGSDEEFTRTCDELLRFTARDVRGRIIRRLPWLVLRRFLPSILPLPRTTTGLLIGGLNAIYRGINLTDILTLVPTAPKLSIVATNLTYAGLTSFENDRVVTYLIADEEPRVWEGTSVPSILLLPAQQPTRPFFHLSQYRIKTFLYQITTESNTAAMGA
jgi:predicted acylesterase/phospholipase RssA